jgi:hypothetical protein
MPRNKIKQDFYFTTLKGFKIIKLTTCDGFYNQKNPAPLTVFNSFSHLFLSCQYLFTLRKYRVLSLVSNYRKYQKIPPFDQRQITFL